MGRKRAVSEDDDAAKDDDADESQPTKRRTASGPSQRATRDDYINSLIDQAVETDDESDSDVVPDPAHQQRVNFEAGQIRKIYVENFMCHRKFTLKLHPGLNFIIGKNGSGKSAVAAAIQLCLGATARNTGRGSSLSGLVREGSTDPAIIRVTLLNTGADAYLPERYGSSITVERKISKGTGVGGYSLKGEDGKEVSTQKAELEKILRAFNIFVDNPCCVLTQDESKKFINGKESDKYEFFLKATGLFSLREELKDVHDNILQTGDTLRSHQQALHAKTENVEALRIKYERLKRLNSLQEKISMLGVKMVWRDVLDAESRCRTQQEAVTAAQRRLDELQWDLEQASTSTDSFDEEVASITAETQRVTDQQTAINDEIRAKKSIHSQHVKQVDMCKHRIVQMEREIADMKRRKTAVEKDIAEQRDKAKASANNEERAIITEIEDLTSRIKDKRQSEEALRAEKNQNFSRISQLQQEIAAIGREEAHLHTDLERIRKDLGALSTGTNRAAIFGSDVAAFATEVAAMRDQFRGSVLGPLGSLVTVKDCHRDLAPQLERAIGVVQRSFLVTNGEDRDRLMTMAQRRGVRGLSVITQSASPRYSVPSLQIDPSVVMVMDALVIPNDLVFNCLVDQASIDRTAIATSEAMRALLVEGDRAHQHLRHGILSVIDEKCSLIKYMNGNKSDEVNRFPFRNVLASDPSEAIAAMERTAEEKAEALRLVRLRKPQVQADARVAQGLSEDMDRQLRVVNTECQELSKLRRRAEEHLREQREASNIDTTAQEYEVHELEGAIDGSVIEVDKLRAELEGTKQALAESAAERQRAEQQHATCIDELKALEERLLTIAKRRRDAERKISTKKKVAADQEVSVRAEQAALDTLQAAAADSARVAAEESRRLLSEWDEQRPDLTEEETRSSLDRSRRQLSAELEQGRRDEALRGESLDRVRDRYERAKSDCDTARELVDTVGGNLALLTEDEATRRQKWIAALKSSVKSTRGKFDSYVQRKGSSGTIDFDHKKETMTVTYQVDNADESSIRNDVRNLSGGERSFVTFSLLLALGHVIESPFRLMDEYDVFMDEPTRKLTLESLVQYVRQADQRERQFIILTPHTLGDLHTSRAVHIFKMPEPVRMTARGPQQQTLAMEP